MRIGLFTLVIAVILTGAGGEGLPAAVRARQAMEAGLVHERLGQHELALTDFAQALASKGLPAPDRVRATFNQGVALDALGRTTQAIGRYSAALSLQHDFAPALNNRGNAYRRLGRFDQAKRDYFAALNCPGAAREYAYYGLGFVAEKSGDVDTARDYYQKALAINPGFALAAQSLGALAAPPAIHLTPVAAAATTSKPKLQVNAPAVGNKKEPDVALRRAILDRPSRGGGASQVQLGAYRDEAMARDAWSKLVASGGSLFEGHAPLIVPVDLPGRGRFWRLRTNVPDAAAGRTFCAEMARRGANCLVVRA